MAFRPIYDNAVDAVADIFDGASIMLGGFSAALGAPHDLFRAVLDSTAAKDLTWIGNGTPQIATVNENGERQTVTFPVGRVKKCICSFPVSPSLRRGFGSPFEAAFGDGTVDLELVPQGTLAERLRAGGAGIPAFYTPTGAGTPFQEGKEVREFDGKAYVLERWLRADFALVRAIKADKLGNLIYRNTARNFNPPMAMAAAITIAEVDEIVEPGELTPEEIVTPGIFVNRIYLRSKSNG